ncbi:MAG TPA: SRPBCC domain-containing protein [Caulobacteraceae bacterium]|nr:SRPBCC domain-containing protein [Caulobacteraceae bacterium]
MRASPAAAWTYERTLALKVAPGRAWALFTDPAETRAWLLPFEEPDDGRQTATIEGQPPITLSVLEATPPALLRTSLEGGNVPGRVETTVRISPTGEGSTVNLVLEGFGDFRDWERFGANFGPGWDEGIADLKIYLHAGVVSPRHIDDRRASIAAWPVRREHGVELVDVFADCFADQAGMKAGDLLPRLDRMGIYEVRDIWSFTRAVPAGAEVRAEYIRDGEVLSGAGRLSRFEDFGE